MKRRQLMIGALACWAAAGVAWAQPDDEHHRRRPGGAGQGGGAPGGGPGGGQQQEHRPEGGQGGERRPAPGPAEQQSAPQQNEQRRDHRQERPAQANGQPRYSASRYPHVMAPRGRYHWNGAWRNQPGYYARRWGYGQVLPYGWFARPFWILDFGDYSLLPPPFGYVWVRVGPDALLVSTASGRIVQVVYGIFY